MQIIDTKIRSNKKYNNPSFQASLARNKAAEVVIDGTLKIASAAVAAIGTAAIALTRKEEEESIENINAKISPDTNSPEIEIIEALATKDARKIYKKLNINEQEISELQLYSEDFRKLLSVAINVYNTFAKNEVSTLEEFLTSLIKECKEETPEKRQKYINKAYEVYKYSTPNNFNLLKQKIETSFSMNDLYEDETLQEHFIIFYRFVTDYEQITGNKFNFNETINCENIKFPNKEEIQKKYDFLQKYPELEVDSSIYFEDLEILQNPKIIEKIGLKKDYPEIRQSIITSVAKTDLDFESAKLLLNSIAQKYKKDPKIKEDYYTRDIREVVQKITKENLPCAIALFTKAQKHEISFISNILEKITPTNVDIISLFASDEKINIYDCEQTTKSKLELVTKEQIESLVEQGVKLKDIALAIQDINEENQEVFDLVMLKNDISAGDKAAIIRNINKSNLSLAKKMIAKGSNSNLFYILSLVNKDNCEIAEKLWEEFKENSRDYQFRNLFRAANFIDIEFLSDILADKRFEKEDGFNDPKISFISHITEANKNLIREIYYNHKDLRRIDLETISHSVTDENLELSKEVLTTDNIKRALGDNSVINLRELCNVLQATTKENINLARYLLKNRPDLCKKGIRFESSAEKLLKSYKGCDEYVIEQINNGILEKHPEIVNLDTDCWKKAIEKNYIVKYTDINLIKYYSISESDDIEIKHQELVKDAFAKRDLLKTGLEDLTDNHINNVFNSRETILALDLIGKTNLEAAFPMMIDNFEDYTRIISNIKLSPENRALLIQIINPTNTPEYKALKKEVSILKKHLNELVGKENLANINKLKKQQAESQQIIEEYKTELKNLQAEYNTNQNPNLETKIQELKTQIKLLEKVVKTLGAQAQSVYFQSKNSAQIKEVMKEISIKTKQAQTIADSTKALDPRDVVLKTRVLAGLSRECPDEEMRTFIEMIKTSVQDKNKAWNDAINKKIFRKIGIEFDENLSERLNFSESKYISELFVSSNEFFRNLKDLVIIIKNNPELSIEEILDTLPENQETKRMFEDLGINYNAWTRINKESYTKVEIELNAEQARTGAIQSLEEDLNDLQFKTLPNEVKDKIWLALAQIGVTFEKSYKDNFIGDGFNAGQEEFWRLYKNGKPVVFNDMPKIVSVIKKTINEDEFWSKQHYDSAIETARGTMHEHLTKLRTADVDKAKALKTDEVREVEIHKTDMYDIKKALGLGNDGQCCTGLGKNFNEWTAPNYIRYKCIGAIELTDSGNFVGNTMIFIANVNGEPALILDNIELKTKYQYNDKIRDAFMKYAEKLCEEIGKPDMPIYAGPNRHKLNMSIYPKDKQEMIPIGSTGNGQVYMDYATSRRNVNGSLGETVELYKIK